MNFNQVILAGHCTRDPSLSCTPNQTAVVDFGIAVNHTWMGKDGSKKESVCFVDVRAFSKTAETMAKYLKKGDPVFLEGRLCFEQWTGQDGAKRSKHRVTVEHFQFLPKGQRQEQNESATPPRSEEEVPFD